jgi:hypothetical protein
MNADTTCTDMSRSKTPPYSRTSPTSMGTGWRPSLAKDSTSLVRIFILLFKSKSDPNQIPAAAKYGRQLQTTMPMTLM